MWGVVLPWVFCVALWATQGAPAGQVALVVLSAVLCGLFGVLMSLVFAAFRHPDLVGVPVYSARASYLRGASLIGANLRKAKLSWVRLQRANLSDAVIEGAKLDHAVMAGATLRGAALVGTDLRDADLKGADLRGADLRKADLRGALLEGVVHDAQTRWPVGVDLPGLPAASLAAMDAPRIELRSAAGPQG